MDAPEEWTDAPPGCDGAGGAAAWWDDDAPALDAGELDGEDGGDDGDADDSAAARIEAFVLRAIARVARGEDPAIDVPGLGGLAGGGGGGAGAAAPTPAPGMALAPGGWGGGGGGSAAFRGARDLAGALRAMRTAYELVTARRTATSREVYYLHAGFFGDQGEANAAVARAAGALGVARHELGVLGGARGWFAGLVSVGEGGGRPPAPSLAPRPVPPECVHAPPPLANAGAAFILVVEKECIFRRLVEDRVWEAAPCVVVTGCGFPDFATRALVHALHTALGLPVLGLSDWNPFGMAIMLVYRWGSRTTPEAARWAVPLRWLGLRHDDVERFRLPPAALQPLTGVDEGRAAALLRDPRVGGAGGARGGGAPALAYEARAFLARREKMELEGVLGRGMGFLAGTYIPAKVAAGDAV